MEYHAFAEQSADADADADAAAAATAIKPYLRLDLEVTDKGGHLFDPMTVADRTAERVMRELIDARYLDHSILGEEVQVSGNSDLTWVLDPSMALARSLLTFRFGEHLLL